MLLASWAIPFVAVIKLLLLLENIETLVKGYCRLLVRLLPGRFLPCILIFKCFQFLEFEQFDRVFSESDIELVIVAIHLTNDITKFLFTII